MAVVAHGKIVIWEGASLWVFEAEERSAQTASHSHHAIQITVALEGDFELRAGEESVHGPAAAVAADASHVFDASGMAALLFIEPESAVGRSLTARWFGENPLRALDWRTFAPFVEGLREAFRLDHADEAFVALGMQIIGELDDGPMHKPTDHRVASMIEFAAANLENSAALHLAAEHVNLSKSRASHLFVEQTGLPLKSYVLWRRLGRAVELYSEGASLTEAAHAASFSDSAHFSRTFRRMFGLPAASLRVRHR